ncbi:hypothetical protein GQR58_024268 [Nymphon striatum]|nr:hypothetical protein GQR58_024268 [Nymphon striatum]
MKVSSADDEKHSEALFETKYLRVYVTKVLMQNMNLVRFQPLLLKSTYKTIQMVRPNQWTIAGGRITDVPCSIDTFPGRKYAKVHASTRKRPGTGPLLACFSAERGRKWAIPARENLRALPYTIREDLLRSPESSDVFTATFPFNTDCFSHFFPLIYLFEDKTVIDIKYIERVVDGFVVSQNIMIFALNIPRHETQMM